MIEEITLVNKTLDQSITLNKTSAQFLLANDKAIDWGNLPSTISTLSSVGLRGTKINHISIASGRDISIIGWVINDDLGTIAEKKFILSAFCDVLSDIDIIAGRYKLSGVFKQAISYSTEIKENNEIICKFMMRLFCENPFFTLVDSEEVSSFKIYKKSFIFPLIWLQSEDIIFGYRQGLSDFVLTNSGTVSTGFEAYIYIGEDISGLSIVNMTTLEEFKTKSGVTLESGDILYINTTPGNYSIQIGTNQSQLVNAFEIFDIDSDFVQLRPGENTIHIGATSGEVEGLGAEFFVRPLFYAIEEQ